MKQEFIVTYRSNVGNQATQQTTVIARDSREAKREIEQRGNTVISTVFKRTIHNL